MNRATGDSIDWLGRFKEKIGRGAANPKSLRSIEFVLTDTRNRTNAFVDGLDVTDLIPMGMEPVGLAGKIFWLLKRNKRMLGRFPIVGPWGRAVYRRVKGNSPAALAKSVPFFGRLLWWAYMIATSPRKLIQILGRMELLEMENARLRKDATKLQSQLDDLGHSLAHFNVGTSLPDDVYFRFEERFRGSRELVKERLTVYLPKLRQIGELAGPVLDLGCGRGEWLELLTENGFTATGVDRNGPALSDAARRGLPVVEEDVFSFLNKQGSGTWGAVSGFHIVEHFSVGVLMRLLREAYRVLRPSGIAIFETPNPENIIVGATSFFLDPTHENPVHPGALTFLVEEAGFRHVEILKLHPLGLVKSVDDDRLKSIVDRFNMEQDYAVVARKAP